MTYKNSKSTEVRYTGKIRSIDGKDIYVSLWDEKEKEQEICGTLSRESFPETKLEVGQIFQYKAGVTLTIVLPRKISKREFSKLEAEVEKKLKGINFDKI